MRVMRIALFLERCNLSHVTLLRLDAASTRRHWRVGTAAQCASSLHTAQCPLAALALCPTVCLAPCALCSSLHITLRERSELGAVSIVSE